MARKIVSGTKNKRRKKTGKADMKGVPLAKLRTNGSAIAMLEAASNKRSELSKEHRKGTRRELRRMYQSAQILAADPDQWFDFTLHTRWEGFSKRPQETDHTEAFDFVVRFFVGFKGKTATRKVYLIKRALRPAFDQGVPANEISKLLRTSGGISGLAKKHCDEDKAEKLGATMGDAPSPVPKIVWKVPSTDFALKIKRISQHGKMRIMASTEIGKDGRITLAITGITR